MSMSRITSAPMKNPKFKKNLRSKVKHAKVTSVSHISSQVKGIIDKYIEDAFSKLCDISNPAGGIGSKTVVAAKSKINMNLVVVSHHSHPLDREN